MAETAQYSNAQSGNWRATAGGLEGVIFKARNFNIPSVSVGSTDLGGPDHLILFETGDKLIFDDLTFDFLVDSNYKNFMGVFRWMKANAMAGIADKKTIDLELLDGEGNPQGIVVEFRECFPTNLSPVLYDAENASTDIIATVTFKFEDFDFI